MPPGSPFPHCIRVSLCKQENTTEIVIYYFLRLGYKRYWSFWRGCNLPRHPLHPITHSPRGELAAMAVVSILSECVSHPAPVEPSDHCSPSQHLYWTSWEVQKNKASQLGHVDDWLSQTVWDNKCLLSWAAQHGRQSDIQQWLLILWLAVNVLMWESRGREKRCLGLFSQMEKRENRQRNTPSSFEKKQFLGEGGCHVPLMWLNCCPRFNRNLFP